MTSADGIIEFTIPAATRRLGRADRRRRKVHIIGTTGHSAEEEAKIKAASRVPIVKSGNMSLGVNLLAALVKRVARTLGNDFDIEILEMHHNKKIDAPSGTALMLGRAAAEGRGIDLDKHSVRGRDGKTGARARRRYRLCRVARRHGGRRAYGDFCGSGRAHRAVPTGRGSHDLCPRRAARGAVGARQEAGLYSMADVLGLADI